jgi:hypothetical protein
MMFFLQPEPDPAIGSVFLPKPNPARGQVGFELDRVGFRVKKLAHTLLGFLEQVANFGAGLIGSDGPRSGISITRPH